MSTISDWARLAQQNPKAAALCTAAEFPTRNDGLPAVEKTYGFDLPDAERRRSRLRAGLHERGRAQPVQLRRGLRHRRAGACRTSSSSSRTTSRPWPPTTSPSACARTTYQANAAAYEALFGAIAKQLTTRARHAAQLQGRHRRRDARRTSPRSSSSRPRSSTADTIPRESAPRAAHKVDLRSSTPGHCHTRVVRERCRTTGGAAGAPPRSEGGGSCTHAPPQSSHIRSPSTRE